MAEVHNSWQDTMGEPYPIPENPVYDASNILRPTTMTPAHADMFNEIFSRLIVNTAAVKSIADSKAGTDTAASDQDGLMSKEDKTALDQAVLNIAALSGILGDGTRRFTGELSKPGNQSRKADRYQTCVCAGSGPREYYQWRYPGNYPG